MKLSIIIPVLNEEKALPVCLVDLKSKTDLLPEHELIIADGGSDDGTRAIAEMSGVKFLEAPRGRGPQMNAGAAVAKGEWLLFLHADSRLTTAAARRLNQICHPERSEGSLVGGCFSQKIDHPNPVYAFIAFTGNLRARLSRIFYGDQGIFVRRAVFESIGGFPPTPILEDIAFTEKLRSAGPVAIQREKIISSPRRWEKTGILRTTLLTRRVVRGYRRGIPPARLKEIYLDVR